MILWSRWLRQHQNAQNLTVAFPAVWSGFGRKAEEMSLNQSAVVPIDE